MSFGFSPSDLFALMKQCKATYDHCRAAPEDFKEVGRGTKGLHFVFETLHKEVQKPDSLLNRDAQHKAHIGEIADNCKAVLTKLDAIVLKHSSLGTAKIKVWDRFTFPRKDILDIQGKLQYHQNNLTAYLQMIGVFAIGRVEQKFDVPGKLHEQIMDSQDRIFAAIDRLAAEVRRGLHPEPVFTSHTVDEEGVWNTFCDKLLKQGFSKQYIQPHEKAGKKRVKELIDLRLCDSDAPNETSDDAESDTEKESPQKLKTGFHSAYPAAGVESGFESEATLPSRPSKIELRRRASSTPMKNKKRDSAVNLDIPSPSSSPSSPKEQSPKITPQSPGSAMRVWTGKDSRLKLKAAFICRQQNYVHLRETDGGETIILASNLSQRDIDHLASLEKKEIHRQQTPITVPKAKQDPQPTSIPEPKRKTSPPEQAIETPTTPILVPEKPEILHGQRTHFRSPWKYRKSKHLISRNAGTTNSLELPLAASRGNYSEVARLLQKGHYVDSDKEEITTTDSDNNPKTEIVHTTTGLYRAAYRGHFAVARLLLEHGANVECSSSGKTILFSVIEDQNLALARLLLEFGARPSVRAGNLNRTPLHLAALAGDLEITELLLEFDALIDARDRSRETPLYLAAMEGRRNTVRALLKEGADHGLMAGDTQTPLYKAAGRGHEKTVRALLMYGADPNHGRGLGGETILFKACKKGFAGIVHELLRYDADVNLANEEKSMRTGSTTDSLIWLLKPEQEPKNVFGLCPLYAAAEAGHEEIVGMLVERGAELDFKRGKDGETAMYVAARRKHKGIAELLYKKGAKIKPQEVVDDVIRIMNPESEEKELEVREKTNRIEVISALMGRLTKQRVQRGVNSWTKTELGPGMDFVTESVRSLAEAQMKKLGSSEGAGLGTLLREGK